MIDMAEMKGVIRMYACIYRCMCVRVFYAYMAGCLKFEILTQKDENVYIYICMYMHVRLHTCIYTYYVCVCIYVCVCVYVCVYIHTYIHTHI
jgi:hypothetical protein